MKCLFQIITRADGTRSPTGCFERDRFASMLREMRDEHGFCAGDDFVLVLLDHCDDDDTPSFSQVPIMTVDHFISHYALETV